MNYSENEVKATYVKPSMEAITIQLHGNQMAITSDIGQEDD